MGLNGVFMGHEWDLPNLVMTNSLPLNMAMEIVSVSIKMGDYI